jgi:hypothetical protein
MGLGSGGRGENFYLIILSPSNQNPSADAKKVDPQASLGTCSIFALPPHRLIRL